MSNTSFSGTSGTSMQETTACRCAAATHVLRGSCMVVAATHILRHGCMTAAATHVLRHNCCIAAGARGGCGRPQWCQQVPGLGFRCQQVPAGAWLRVPAGPDGASIGARVSNGLGAAAEWPR
eukprot:356430-Chlamydomonas_euryale.AAC.1